MVDSGSTRTDDVESHNDFGTMEGIGMSNESTQPFNINDNTGQPSHRPEHDKAREDVDERLHDDDAEPVKPEAVQGEADN